MALLISAGTITTTTITILLPHLPRRRIVCKNYFIELLTSNYHQNCQSPPFLYTTTKFCCHYHQRCYSRCYYNFYSLHYYHYNLLRSSPPH